MEGSGRPRCPGRAHPSPAPGVASTAPLSPPAPRSPWLCKGHPRAPPHTPPPSARPGSARPPRHGGPGTVGGGARGPGTCSPGARSPSGREQPPARPAGPVTFSSSPAPLHPRRLPRQSPRPGAGGGGGASRTFLSALHLAGLTQRRPGGWCDRGGGAARRADGPAAPPSPRPQSAAARGRSAARPPTAPPAGNTGWEGRDGPGWAGPAVLRAGPALIYRNTGSVGLEKTSEIIGSNL